MLVFIPATYHTHSVAYAQDDAQSCADVNQLRAFQTAVPVEPTTAPTADPNAPTVTPRPATATPRPAPQEDRVGFPEGYPENYKLLFVFDRPDNQQVRVICGNELAASVQPGEPFPYGSILVMETWRTKKDADGKAVRDENGHYIREALTGIFVQRKEEGFGAEYLEDQSGEWEYVAYRPNGDYLIPPPNTNNCASCHLRQAGEGADFAFRMALYHQGDVAATPQAMAENEVNVFIYEFMPMTLSVKAGTTVTWINTDEVDHTVVADDASFSSEVLASTLVQPGASFSLTFDTPGTYNYFCDIHPNMTGVIEVVQ
jgi:plastocyanin